MKYTDGTREATIGPWHVGSEVFTEDGTAGPFKHHSAEGWPFFIHGPDNGIGRGYGVHIASGIQDKEAALLIAATPLLYDALDNLIHAAETGYGVKRALQGARNAMTTAKPY